MTMAAQVGGGPELADALLRVAAHLEDAPGCVLYAVAHDEGDPDTVRVIEVWADAASAEAALRRSGEGRLEPAEILKLLTGPPDRINLVLLGGVGTGSNR
jgi:quinol monooxygenase YgiN